MFANGPTVDIYKDFIEIYEIFIVQKFTEENNITERTGTEKIKTKLNLMELKPQIVILEDKTLHYTTKYLKIDQELISEIREFCPIKTAKNCKKEEENVKQTT